MARSPVTFRQRDVTATLKAVRNAGCSVARVHVAKDGEIIVDIGEPISATGEPANDDRGGWEE